MPSPTIYTFRGKVWQFRSWYMVSLPQNASNGIRELYHGLTGGFGSLPVQATVGTSTFTTSVFPENKNGAYMLPLKKAVRKAENFSKGDIITFTIQILV